MIHIVHKVAIKAPAEKVFSALTTLDGLAGWWTEDVSGQAQAGGQLEFTFKSTDGSLLGSMQMSVQDLMKNKKVHWKCQGGPEEWINTEIFFDLSVEGDYTTVSFAHRNWEKESDFTAHCSTKWATFLLSLRSFIETGKGLPAPHDLKIDTWN